jgi:hypothetical protein
MDAEAEDKVAFGHDFRIAMLVRLSDGLAR